MNTNLQPSGNIQRSAERAVNMAEIALRGSTTLIDIQFAAMRNLVKMQARGAALFGLPDCSELFGTADNLVKDQLQAGTDQLLNSTRQVAQAVADTQRQLNRIVQQSASHLTEGVRKGIEEIGQRTRASVQELTDITQRQADEAEREFEAMRRASEESQNRMGMEASNRNDNGAMGSDMPFRPSDEASRSKPTQPRKN